MEKQFILKLLFTGFILNICSLYAQEISYNERFINLTGENASLETVGWSGIFSLKDLPVYGVSGGLGTEVASDNTDYGYIFVYTSTTPNALIMANTQIERSTEIDSIGFALRNVAGDFRYGFQVAVEIDNSWYVNTKIDTNTQSSTEENEFEYHYFKWTTKNWKRLIVDPFNRTKLSISSEPAADLPDGDLNNFGFYSVHPGGGSLVIDEVTVYGGVNGGSTPPGPSYLNNFDNTTDENIISTKADWLIYSSNQATPLIPNDGGISPSIGAVIFGDDNDKGYLYAHSTDPANILFTANHAIDRFNEIDSIEFILRDHPSFSYGVHVAVNILGDWYVNVQADSGIVIASGESEYNLHSFEWTTTGWKSLAFDSEDPSTLTIAEGEVMDLPNGFLDNFGFFAQHPGGGSVVLDKVTIYNAEDLGFNGDNMPPLTPQPAAEASTTTNEIMIKWKPVPDFFGAVDKFKIYNGDQVFIRSEKDTIAIMNNLDWASEYSFYVTAIDTNGNESGFSSKVSATIIQKPLSISNINTLIVELYPNPVNDFIKISSEENFEYIKLFDSRGTLVKTYKAITSNSISLDTGWLNSGMYIINIVGNSGKTISKKIIKE